MPLRKKSSITVAIDNAHAVSEIADKARMSRSDVYNAAVEQMLELIKSPKESPDLSPWVKMFRDQEQRSKRGT
tara:strand:+ start:569 stop:787 length:219 start_codon:yes stop_codon:yes gene_type:complete